MKFIQGKDRNQIAMFSLDQAIDQDNEVRLIDMFVGSLTLSDEEYILIENELLSLAKNAGWSFSKLNNAFGSLNIKEKPKSY